MFQAIAIHHAVPEHREAWFGFMQKVIDATADAPGLIEFTAYAEAGADLVELGVPFSDPLADGPVIHSAATRALDAGATLDGVLEIGPRHGGPGTTAVVDIPLKE